MTKSEAVRQLMAIADNQASEPESAHYHADQILYQLAHPKVQEAYSAVRYACNGFRYD